MSSSTRNADECLARAWACFDARQLDEALDEARQACAQAAERPDCFAALGWFLLEAGQTGEAGSLLRSAIARHPAFPPLHWYLGLLNFRQGRLDEARCSLEQALQLEPGLDEAAVSLAWVLHDLGRIAEAIAWARKALAARTQADRQAQLGWLLLLHEEYGEAATLLQAALSQAPASLQVRCNLVSALQHLRRFDEATEVLENGLARSPDEPDLLLTLGWLYRSRGEVEAARAVAARLVDNHPELASAWHLLGVIWHECGHLEKAESCFAEAQARDESLTDALVSRASILRKTNRPAEAATVLHAALRMVPGHVQAQTELVSVLVDQGATEDARRGIHRLLREAPRDGALWHLLARILWQRRRRNLALHALRRAHRLAPNVLEIWRTAGWLALEGGDLVLARAAIDRLLEVLPDDFDSRVQAAFVLEACGELDAAAAQAELAVAGWPGNAQAWRSLAKVRHRQNRLEDAESALRTALEIAPENTQETCRQLGWVLVTAGRLEAAEAAFARAMAENGADPLGWLELAEVRCRAGRFATALDALEQALRARPDWAQAKLRLARVLAERSRSDWGEAVAVCSRLLLERAEIPGAALLLMRLAAQGDASALGALRLIERPARPGLFADALMAAQGERGNEMFCRLAALAHAGFPENIALATAAFFACGLDEKNSAADIARHARVWCRQLAATTGANAVVPVPVRQNRPQRLRVAYVAAHFHRSLLARVLAAHDRHRVDVFLYTDAPTVGLGDLGPHVVVQPLHGQDLAASMFANRIDVAIDTVGIHPFLGQFDVLRQFAGRVAPLQCAWLGSWASGGGVFDAVIADDASLPQAQESHYEEQVIRLPGGQWCWEAPAFAPEPSPPPCADGNGRRFGSAVRGLRLTRRTQEAWARILSRVPEARLELIGEQSHDWLFQAEFADLLVSHGVEPARVRYRPRRDYADYLAFYNGIDIALDAFPANGGLCQLDALWMGVPLVTRAGALLGERQCLSLLTSVGHPEWAASDDAAYVDIAVALAGDRDALTGLRRGLRQEILASPLLDGRRVAAALEQAYLQLVGQAQDVAAAESATARSRASANRQFSTWHAKQSRIDFSAAAPAPGSAADVSVVVVLFNQAGLSRNALLALADQTGISYEVIVIDNASSDDARMLLDRLDGARVVRNRENLGFLRAANQGAAQAGGRHILFLNSDTVLQPEALLHAVRRLDAEADVGAVGGKVVLGDATLQEAGCIAYRDGSTIGYGRGQDPTSPEFRFERDVDFCSGAFLMVRRVLWERLGGFDTAYAPAYYEDTDFCMRIWRAGSRVVYEPQARVSHLEWGSAASNDEVHRLMERNRQRFHGAHRERLESRSDPAFSRPAHDRWLARRRQRVLVVDNAVPHPASGGGLPRARCLLHALRGYDVTLYPLWIVDEDWREVYASIPPAVEVMLGSGASGLERFLEARAGVYDFIIVSRPPNMALVEALWERRPGLFRGMRLVYDAEAVFALREIGQARLTRRPLSRQEAIRRLDAEMALARRAATVLAVSKREAALFRRAGAADVRILAHSMATREQVPGREHRTGLLFVGALRPDTPNEDGLLWFAREVLPLLRERLGQAPVLHIVGECHSGKIAALAATGIRLVGRVDDPTPYYDGARVFVAPARFAAGIPAKVIEAACNGIPVVASHLLVRQLAWRAGTEILSAPDASSFADAIARLYCDDDLWSAVQRAAGCRTRAEAAPERFERILRDALAGRRSGEEADRVG